VRHEDPTTRTTPTLTDDWPTRHLGADRPGTKENRSHTEAGMKWTASMGYRRFPDLPLDPPDVAGREDHDPPEDREDDSTPIHPEQDEA
jgi:hypothetical protein